MRAVQIIGAKNSGKTTLIVDLLERLTARGLRVGTIKHSPHPHDLDKPGSDSDKHRLAGSCPTLVIAGERMAIHLPCCLDAGDMDRVAPLFDDCDVVLVEGNPGLQGEKIEVWRAESGREPLALQDASIVALISDDRPPVSLPVWPRRDIDSICDGVLAMAGLARIVGSKQTVARHTPTDAAALPDNSAVALESEL